MVSIITPTHREMPLLDLVIESVMNQTYENWEWVVLDITEHPYFKNRLIKFMENHPQYQVHYPKVRVFEKYMIGENIGKVKRECISHLSCAQNEWTIQLDHDDILFKTTLEDIIKCNQQYGDQIDYMSGDRQSAFYIMENNMFYPCYYSDSKNYELVDARSLEVGNWNLGVNENWNAVRYIKMTSGDIAPIHPRILRKRHIDNPIFAPGIIDFLHEDLIQQTIVGYALKGAWIKRPLILDITYKNEDQFLNTSRNIEKTEIDNIYPIQKSIIQMFDNILGSEYERNFVFFEP